MNLTNKKLIFVSCGQLTEEEKQLGSSVKSLIDDTEEFEAYFAETVHDLAALAHHIFDALQRCSGAIGFLHNRGLVTDSGGETWGIRSSVWVNQEIGILAFRQFLESASIPILLFKENNVKLEGAMTSFITNPLPLLGIEDTLERIRDWLYSEEFAPCLADEFTEKWNKLSLNSRKVLSCLADEGSLQVKETNIWRKLKRKYAFSGNEASKVVMEAKLQFIDTGLVICDHNIHTGDEMTFHPTWRWYLSRAARSVDQTDI
ncbi:hypothetical protein KAT92_03965 [Candidatus Babeliales bacterium]|nr:hypothetical protein [Candidatus Babeliales bacterium]